VRAEELRQQANGLSTGFRGYERTAVIAYVARLALALDALADVIGQLPELPPDLTPDLIAKQEFPVVWRGLQRRGVRALLNEVAPDFYIPPMP